MPNKYYSLLKIQALFQRQSFVRENTISKRLKRANKQALHKSLRVIAIGSRVFVTSFQLAGIEGINVDSPSEALDKINSISSANDVGLILLSDDLGRQIRNALTSIRSKSTIPLIFELPSPGSSKENVDYRALLKQILGV